MIGFNPGGTSNPRITSGFGGPSSLFASGGSGFLDAFKGFGDFLGSQSGQGLLGLGSLGLQGFGLNKALDFQNDQLGLLQDQENRAATAQNLQTGNSLSLALQTTTPGTPEHERIKQAIADGSFAV